MPTTSNATSAPAATSTAAAANAATAASFDPEAFLKLLTTELQNQDPTSPMQTDQMMSQLATISQVEQAVQTNTKLDNLLAQQALTQAATLIGHQISSSDGTQTGIVQSVHTSATGTSAILSDGSTLDIGSGITVQS